MEINMETIGYILYGGLVLSVLSFLYLVMAMFTKKEPEPMFDQALNSNYEEDMYEEEDEEDEEIEVPTKKFLFGFGKKNKKTTQDDEFEVYEEEVDSDEDGFGIYKDNQEKEDEYQDDFEFSFGEDNGFIKKNRNSVDKLDLERYNFRDDEDDFNGLEIKQYEDEKESDISYNRIEDKEIDEEDEMIRRIKSYNDKFKK